MQLEVIDIYERLFFTFMIASFSRMGHAILF